MGNKYLVVLASLNEELAIGNVLTNIKKFIPDADILVVDGYSRDKTVEVSLNHGAKVIQVDKAYGIAGAVEAGILYASQNNHSHLIRLDADGQHPPEEIAKILSSNLDNDVDFVLGSRYLGEADYSESLLRKISISSICLLLKVLHKVNVTDCTSGCHIYSKNMIDYFAKNSAFEYSEVRIIWMAHEAGFKIKETFINMAPRLTGESSFTPLNAANYMFKNLLDLILSMPLFLKINTGKNIK
jgi:glycosyltransferase involved in cell wall biosynthesis